MVQGMAEGGASGVGMRIPDASTATRYGGAQRRATRVVNVIEPLKRE